MRIIVSIAACFVLTLLLLAVSYPPWDEVGYFSYGVWDTAFAYFLVALIASGIAAGFSPALGDFLSRRTRQRRTVGTVLSFAFSLVSLGALTVALGPGPLDAPGRIRGIFFAEWMFVTFAGYVALPLSFFSGLAYIYRTRPAVPKSR